MARYTIANFRNAPIFTTDSESEALGGAESEAKQRGELVHVIDAVTTLERSVNGAGQWSTYLPSDDE